MISVTGEYQEKGDYHANPDRKWRYLPVYNTKMELVNKLVRAQSTSQRILDVGAGEGVLVRRFKTEGYNIQGVDLNYSSKDVIQGSVLKLPFKDGEFDTILCLDMLEHLSFPEQIPALNEIHRVLKAGGVLIISLPNLAHLASRVTFLFLGRLLRTSSIDRHPGDRPIAEFLKILRSNFVVRNRYGLFPTLPLISGLTYFFPQRVTWLHQVYNLLLGRLPNICFLNVIVVSK